MHLENQALHSWDFFFSPLVEVKIKKALPSFLAMLFETDFYAAFPKEAFLINFSFNIIVIKMKTTTRNLTCTCSSFIHSPHWLSARLGQCLDSIVNKAWACFNSLIEKLWTLTCRLYSKCMPTEKSVKPCKNRANG